MNKSGYSQGGIREKSPEVRDKKLLTITQLMAELGDEELTLKKPREAEPMGTQFDHFGWWTDAKGHKQYGPIPKTEQERNDRTRTSTRDSWLYN